MSPSKIVHSTMLTRLVLLGLGLLLALATSIGETKLLRRSRYYDEPPYDVPFGAGSTGERSIITVRGARNPYDGTAPSKIAIQDEPYRGAYPRGVYDRLDSYSSGRYPHSMRPAGYSMLRPDSYTGYGSGPYGGSVKRRQDFMDPDFGVKLRLASNGNNQHKRSKCRVGADVDSEIPELGLDTGRLSIDCDVNPIRVAGAAYRAATRYNQYRQNLPRQSAPSTAKKKRTRISFERDYEHSHQPHDSQEDETAQPSNDYDDDDD